MMMMNMNQKNFVYHSDFLKSCKNKEKHLEEANYEKFMDFVKNPGNENSIYKKEIKSKLYLFILHLNRINSLQELGDWVYSVDILDI